jgi:hypothetical protein
MTGFGSVLFLGQKPVQTGLARFFPGLALFFLFGSVFSVLLCFFSVSVWFFWFFAYKIKTKPNWPVFLNF